MPGDLRTYDCGVALVEPDYQPYQGGAFRWRLGLRALDLADWIQIGPAYERDMATKRDILARHPGTVLSFVQGIQEEASEVLRALVQHLTNRWPQWFSVTDGAITNHRTGETFLLDGQKYERDSADGGTRSTRPAGSSKRIWSCSSSAPRG